ncbi:MAG: DNA methyltransferase [Isosphaeraceae bacterium]
MSIAPITRRPAPSIDVAPAESLPTERLQQNPFSIGVYGEIDVDSDGLLGSIEAQGILVPLVVAPVPGGWEVVSGHRRLACARRLGFREIPATIRDLAPGDPRRQAVLDYNIQRRKNFSQMMREADALESLMAEDGRRRRRAGLRQFRDEDEPVRRDPDERPERTDRAIARRIGLGGKDLYRQGRAVWKAAGGNDPRARAAVGQIDAGTKTIHAAYKDLRRRSRFTAGFRPTPYDVWAFRHDPAFGVPHPGSIPPAIVAHALHYFSRPGDLVVDPMAGGGTTLDVAEAMGRRCLAYDIHPVRPDIRRHDVRNGIAEEACSCDLIFCDPPYHTMLAEAWGVSGIAEQPLAAWNHFLENFSRNCYAALRPGGYVALLLANQTEKDLPAGVGYLDHGFLGYAALAAAGFRPERRISCPMQGAYLPQHVRRARSDGRLLGQVRDLLIMRKPLPDQQ